MPESKTFAEQMVEKYEALLLKYAGFKSVSIDGQTTTIDELEAKYEHWKSVLARETAGGCAKTISMRNF